MEGQSVWEFLPTATIKDLEKFIIKASDAYYNQNESIITDEEFDALVEKLRILDPDSELLKTIGAAGGKTKLPCWLGSMDKIKTDDGSIGKWEKRYGSNVVVSDKLDGISCLLVSENKRIKLYTRGDGSHGRDITHLSKLINLEYGEIPNDKLLIRGELIIPVKKFTKYSAENSNPRSMASGVVVSKTVNKKYAKIVDFVAYEIIEPVMKPSDQMLLLEKWGFKTVFNQVLTVISYSILDNIYNGRRTESPYDIDGIIVTCNKEYVRNESGNPKYSFAYKGKTETVNVKVIDVVWVPSKDGNIIPVVHYKKTLVSKVMLNKATGINARNIVNNGIGKGAIITIIRSGDVIPKIINVIKKVKAKLPTEYDYEWDTNNVHIVLKNPDQHKIVIIKRLTKFARVIGVDNMSIGIVTKLYDAGYNTIFKIISLTEEEMVEIEGFQKTLSRKIYNNLQTALDNLDILGLMVASNLMGRGMGNRKIEKILESYPDIVTEYHEDYYQEWYDCLMELEGYDSITVKKFLDNLPNFIKFYNKFVDISPVKPYNTEIGERFLDMKILFTGFRNADWKKIIEDEGGKVVGNVSKNTDLVVYGPKSESKLIKANQLGLKTMTKEEFEIEYMQ
jgi:DNA ligase (NAD+)